MLMTNCASVLRGQNVAQGATTLLGPNVLPSLNKNVPLQPFTVVSNYIDGKES